MNEVLRMMQIKRNLLVGMMILLCLALIFFSYGDQCLVESNLVAEQSPTVTQTLPVEKDYTFSKDIPELILVNKSVRLDRSYDPTDLKKIQGVYLREIAATALTQMIMAAEQEGIHGLIPFSGYRSYGTQESVYANKIASLRPKYGGEAEDLAQRLVAPPGSSEHQTGLAIDITLKKFLDYEYVLNYDFADTEQGQWLSKNSWKYGFILRYSESKEDTTNFSYEPWHFRYVGMEHAKAMYELDLCLEEYISRFGK